MWKIKGQGPLVEEVAAVVSLPPLVTMELQPPVCGVVAGRR